MSFFIGNITLNKKVFLSETFCFSFIFLSLQKKNIYE
jgi:hypothetical protein